MEKIISFLLALCICLTLGGCNAPEPIGAISAYLEGLNEEGKLSAVVLIARDGKPVLERAYGLANRDYDVPNQVDTKFNLGSMNKMFTAVAILQLVEQGRLTVDDKVITYIPDYPNQEVASKITIHQLLTHTSGTGDFFTTKFSETSKERFKELEDYLSLFVDKPVRFEPGTEFFYSNAGFIILGLIIEEVSGQSYFDYIREHIYQPCGMTNTDSYELDGVIQNVAIGYIQASVNEISFMNNLYLIPVKGSSAGGGYSTAGDMLKFSNCLLNNQLLSPELTEILLEGKVEDPNLPQGAMYAYGFVDRWSNNHRIVGHSGGAPGVCSNMDIYLDLGYVVVILTNGGACSQVNLFIKNELLK